MMKSPPGDRFESSRCLGAVAAANTAAKGPDNSTPTTRPSSSTGHSDASIGVPPPGVRAMHGSRRHARDARGSRRADLS